MPTKDGSPFYRLLSARSSSYGSIHGDDVLPSPRLVLPFQLDDEAHQTAHDECLSDVSRLDHKCTNWETTWNLISVVSGAGMLSLPFAAASMGSLAVVLLFILGGIFMYCFQLLAESIETHRNYLIHRHARESHSKETIFPIGEAIDHIDYLTFGQLSFGKHGDKIVLVLFSMEMLLALMSMFLNIGLNIRVLCSHLALSTGIVVSAVLTMMLSWLELKLAAFSSMLGIMMTSLIVFALLYSGFALEYVNDSPRVFEWFNPSGLPMSMGLIAFCFGGHGTL
jgi:amino acid permease